MADKILIEFEANLEQLHNTIALLEKLGKVDAATAAEFKQATDGYKKRDVELAAVAKQQASLTTEQTKAVASVKDLAANLKAAATAAQAANDGANTYTNTVAGLTAKLADLKSKAANLDLGSKAFNETKEEIRKVNAELIVAAGRQDEFGTRIRRGNSGIVQAYGEVGTAIAAAFAISPILGFSKSTEEAEAKENAAQKALAQIVAAREVAIGLAKVQEVALDVATKARTVSTAIASTVMAAGGAIAAVFAGEMTLATAATLGLEAALAVLTAPFTIIIGTVALVIREYLAFTEASNETEEATARLNEELARQKKILDFNKTAFDDVAKERARQDKNAIDLLKAKGGTDKQIHDAEIAAIKAQIKIREDQVQAQVNNAKTVNKETVRAEDDLVKQLAIKDAEFRTKQIEEAKKARIKELEERQKLVDEINKLNDQIQDKITKRNLDAAAKREKDQEKTLEYSNKKELDGIVKVSTADANSFLDGLKQKEEAQKKFNDFVRDQAAKLANDILGFAVDASKAQSEEELKAVDDKFQKQQDDLDKRKNAELANKNLTESQRQGIEDKYAAKKKKLDESKRAEEARIKTEEFQKEKAAKVIQSIIEGALATVKAFADGGPLLAFAAGLFAASQTALIVAQPVPKFAKGTKSVPGVDMGRDSVMAMLQPGEKVFPVERSRKYQPILDAIFDERITPGVANQLAYGDMLGGGNVTLNGGFNPYDMRRVLEGAALNLNNPSAIGKSIATEMLAHEYSKDRYAA